MPHFANFVYLYKFNFLKILFKMYGCSPAHRSMCHMSTVPSESRRGCEDLEQVPLEEQQALLTVELPLQS